MDRIKPPTPLALLREMIVGPPIHWRNQLLGCRLRLIEDFEVISLILQGHSFVRWGDGETAIVRGKSISYQESVEQLRDKLEKLSNNPPSKLIFGLPWVTYASIFDRRWNKRIFGIMFSTRVYWARNLGEQFQRTRLSRTEFWWDHAHEISSILQNLQNLGRQLVLVGPKKFLALCPKGTSFIEIDLVDAFTNYENLSRTILKLFEQYGHSLTLVAAAGPTTKALVNDFADRIQVLDIGHGFDFALNGYGSWSWSSKNRNLNND